MPNIRKVLDISTGHLDPASKAWLDAASADTSVMAGYYGWLTPVCGETVEELDAMAETKEWPPVLHTILRHARGHDADFVLFDADAPYDDDLPSFDEEGNEEIFTEMTDA